MSEFYQQGPRLGNQFTDDALLRDFLAWRCPPELQRAIEPGLEQLGERTAVELPALAEQAEREPPRLVHFDAWGRRVDRIEVSQAWQALHAVAAEEGIVATAFEREHGDWSRLHQFCRLYLFNPSSAVYSCPLAMTDGAARLLELQGNETQRRELLPHLTSRDPAQFWTSGQWMTERSGGSDVRGTTTEAHSSPDGEWRLYGSKWFTSAITSEVALALARTPDSGRLSLYCLRTRTADGAANNIRIHRLKDKLGTRAMPTAELTLEGTPATLLGEPGQGVRTVSTMLNVTRLYNAVCAVSAMRRAVALARDYARRRRAFGRTLAEHPLHLETLAGLELELRAGFHLVFHLGMLMGREEAGVASAEEAALLRLLTPVAKLYTGKQVVAVTSEMLECFGGAGYIEDTGLPRLLRDAQVLPIWEGTTNVLSLDVLRVLHQGDAFTFYLEDIERRLASLRDPALTAPALRVREALGRLQAYLHALDPDGTEEAEAGARGFAFGLARCQAAGLMLEIADWAGQRAGTGHHHIAAERWCAGELTPLVPGSADRRATTRVLALG